MKRRLLGLAGVSLLLAACNPQPTPPTPETKKAGAVYQVNFRVNGLDSASATMQKVSAGLSGQALENAPEPVDMNFTSMTTSTFVAKQGGVDMRHLHLTFPVTNNSGQAITNLTFLPVIRADADSEPTNNTQTPTVPGTPFMNVQLFDGTNANDQAPNIRTTQAKEVNIRTGEVTLNTSASPYLTNLDVSKLSATVAPGLTGTVMNSGWVAAPTLAAGATGYVTLAVDIPVDRTQPKTQPFSFSMLITTAQDVNGTGVGASIDPGRIQGIIQPWDYKAGEKLRALFYPDYLGGTANSATVDLGDIGSDGSVNLNLPTPPSNAIGSFLQSCTFSGKQTATNIGYTLAYLSAVSVDGDRHGAVAIRGSDGTRVYPFYSTSDAQFTGTATCPGRRETMDLDFKVNMGWNVIRVLVDDTDPNAIKTTIRNLSAGIRTDLRFTQNQAAVTVTSTDYSPMTLIAGGAGVTRSVSFGQRGGINGDITLETNVPGITVSPNTATLPSFTTASLTTQALTTNLTFSAAADASEYSGQLELIVKQNGAEIGRGLVSFSATVTLPYVTTAIGYPYNLYYPATTVAIGETLNIPVSVTSQNGFTGTTTITLSPLPAGVIASTESVTLTAGATAQVNVTLTITRNAALGSLSLFGSGPKVKNIGEPPANFKIIPQRYELNLASLQSEQAAPAINGLWVMGRDSGGTLNIVRLNNGALVQQEPVNVGAITSVYSADLLPGANGDAMTVVYGYDGVTNSYVVTLYRSDSTRTSQTLSNLSPAAFPSSGVVDAGGNLWFTEGYSPSTLRRLDLTTGTVETINEISGGLLVMSLNGMNLNVLNTTMSSVTLTTVNTSTRIGAPATALSRSISTSPNPGFIADNAGNLYGLEYGTLIKVSADGQVITPTITPYTSLNKLYGIDRTSSNLIWMKTSSGIATIDLNTLTVIQKDYQDTSGGAIDLVGGFWEILPNSYSGPFYVSYLP